MPVPQPQDWSGAYAKTQRLADRSLLAALKQALLDVDRMLRQIDPTLGRVGDLVRIQQLQTVKRNLLNRQGQIYNRMGDIIAERRVQAAEAATALGSDIDALLLDFAGRTEVASQLRASLNAGLRQTIDVAITRMTISAVPLAQRIYNSNVWANGVLQRRINSALLRGLSAREFAKEARDWFRPDTPGGVRYAAFRLARTEINNAFHATSVLQAQEKPWLESMQWHLSRSHPKPDTCDALSKGGPKGDGIYPKMEVPKKPHPQCFCFVTPVVPDEDEFLDNLVAGNYDQYLRTKLGQAQARPRVEPVKPKKVAPRPAAPKKVTAPDAPAAPITPPSSPTPRPVVKSQAPVPHGAQPYHLSLDGIEDLADTVENATITNVKRLTGGVSADTELVTFSNGKQLVRKSAGTPGAEQASSVIGRAIGTRAPRVYRNHPGEVWMDYVSDAKTAAELQARANKAGNLADLRKEHFALAESDEGLRVGLFDLLIRNGDRNTGNWMTTEEAKRIIPIDHGHARPTVIDGRPLPQLSASGPFVEQIFLGISKNNKFTPADIDWARGQVMSVGQDLSHMGHKDFRDYALAVLDKLQPFAKGTRNILAP